MPLSAKKQAKAKGGEARRFYQYRLAERDRSERLYRQAL